jgi:hypothetical protein
MLMGMCLQQVGPQLSRQLRIVDVLLTKGGGFGTMGGLIMSAQLL